MKINEDLNTCVKYKSIIYKWIQTNYALEKKTVYTAKRKKKKG